MARPKKPRKPSEQGVAKTFYLRFGVVQDLEREARRDNLSASAVAELLLVEGIEKRRAARAVAAA